MYLVVVFVIVTIYIYIYVDVYYILAYTCTFSTVQYITKKYTLTHPNRIDHIYMLMLFLTSLVTLH